MLNNIGAEVYQSWSEEQRQTEIGKLVQGYRSGVPISIVCLTAEAIAGSRARAKKHLSTLMTAEDRLGAIASAGSEIKEVRKMIKAMLG